jgi:histidinol dehydrogenase
MGEAMTTLLRRVTLDEIAGVMRPAVDDATLDAAREIVERVRTEGEAGVRVYAERFDERGASEALVIGRAEMDAALASINDETRGLLERVAGRIDVFARAQRDAIGEVDIAVPGGRAGHTVEPVASAGCYAPGGRYPLVSSVLMTAVTARAAGCERVVVASPGAHELMLAAAAVAGADQFLCVGGAHAIAALAHGIEGLERCDVVVGPGNAWVTAAKQLVSGVVGIDMLAGPSELLVLADESADADVVAADLLAQAEHDADASAMLVTTSAAVADDVERAIARRLAELSTRETARVALRNGFCCVVRTVDEMLEAGDRIAAEHVEVITRDAEDVARRLRNGGGMFIGARSAEVLGDYGAGPNHTLPTGGTARFRAGLSVQHFLRLRTWLRIDDADAARGLIEDARTMSALEGLEGHGKSAAIRLDDHA